MHFFVDAMFPRDFVKLIQSQGHGATHSNKLGYRGTVDAEMWQLACQQDGVVLTKDLDFLVLANKNPGARLVIYRQGNLKFADLLSDFNSNFMRILKKLESGERVIVVK
jgi:predicted nuclease of predicted toxin-antitoxin system